MTDMLQPLLHEATVVLRAPVQAWSDNGGSMGSAPIHGIYYSDVRVVSGHTVTVGGVRPEALTAVMRGASEATFISVVRGLAAEGADPGVRSELRRTVAASRLAETFTVQSRLPEAVDTQIEIRLRTDLSDLDRIKQGHGPLLTPAEVLLLATKAGWANDDVAVLLSAPGADVSVDGDELVLLWTVTVPSEGAVIVGWELEVTDDVAVVAGDESPASWSTPVVAGDERLSRWLAVALADLDALRLTTTREPELGFIAAGAPWFFTLFGRDSLWTARFMLPLGTGLAASTLRVLAGLQGTKEDADTAEEPGKIMHELRRAPLRIESEDVYLPPLYYGTVDATALWVCLLHDSWRWGLDDETVRSLMPSLEAALAWLRDFADADGDGLLEYVDRSGHGLANQGWKDSGDSVQWRDGHIATGPIALCEVQGYAYEAATHGADLIDYFGGDGTEWREWADALREKFHATFWIGDPDGSYPAIALDGHKNAVDSLTSNIGHLLGTGILNDAQSALVARRLVSPALNSGYGLRTLATDARGYWPMSYHGGSVWTHDTAIAISGLRRAGFAKEAVQLIDGLLAAASGFDYRVPELHSGDSSATVSRPVPYPAACRPQGWSAAASVSVLASVLGLEPDAQDDVLGVSPAASAALKVSGLTFNGQPVSISLNDDGEVTGAEGANIEVR